MLKKSDTFYLRITAYYKQCEPVNSKNGEYCIHCQSRPSELDNDLVIEQYECDQHAQVSVSTVTRSQLSIYSSQDRFTQPSTSAAASSYDQAQHHQPQYLLRTKR